VDLRLIAYARGAEAETLDGPVEIDLPFRFAQRQPFAKRRIGIVPARGRMPAKDRQIGGERPGGASARMARRGVTGNPSAKHGARSPRRPEFPRTSGTWTTGLPVSQKPPRPVCPTTTLSSSPGTPKKKSCKTSTSAEARARKRTSQDATARHLGALFP
jgi:hypothetical protein